MKKRVLEWLLAVAMVGTLLSGCSNGTNQTTNQTANEGTAETAGEAEDVAEDEEQNGGEEFTISYLIPQSVFKEAHQQMADQLKENEGITVDFQVVPDEQFDSLLLTKIATGEVPDVAEINVPSSLATFGVENLVDLSDEAWIERLVNPELIRFKDGKIYGQPRQSSSFFGACYYNKEVMDSLGIENPHPKTYQEFLEILEQIKNEGDGITPIYMANADSWMTQIFCTLGFSIATYPEDEQIYNDLLTNKKKFTDVPEFEAILTDFLGLYEAGYVNENHLSAKYEQAQEAVAKGEAAMLLCGEWSVTDIHAKWPDTEMGSFVIPFADKDMMGTGAYVNGVVVFKDGAQADNAKRFLDFWSQPEYGNIMYEENPGSPGFEDVNGGDVDESVQKLVDEYIATNNYTYQINDQMEGVSPIFPELWQYYIEAVMGEKTPREALEAWQVKYEDFMKESGYEGF